MPINRFDIVIEKLTNDMLRSVSDKEVNQFDSDDVLRCAEDLKYVLTKICAAFISNKSSYSKVAVLVGVLEDVKRDFCSRVMSTYEPTAQNYDPILPQ